MRHVVERSIGILGLAILAFDLMASGTAQAQVTPPNPNASLRGSYNVTLVKSCATTGTETFQGSGSFIATGTPPIIIQGTASYDGNGGGSFTGQLFNSSGSGAAGTGISLGIPPGGIAPVEVFATQINLNPCTLTYTVNADGTFTQAWNCTGTFLTGPSTGLTNTQTFVLEGHISLDGTILVIGKTSLAFETATAPTGPFVGQPFNRLCSTQGLATSRR